MCKPQKQVMYPHAPIFIDFTFLKLLSYPIAYRFGVIMWQCRLSFQNVEIMTSETSISTGKYITLLLNVLVFAHDILLWALFEKF